MSGEWQTWAALGVVAITAVAFVVRAVLRRRAAKKGCANAADCGCGGAKLGNARRGTEHR
jgi:hypothetical protein